MLLVLPGKSYELENKHGQVHRANTFPLSLEFFLQLPFDT